MHATVYITLYFGCTGSQEVVFPAPLRQSSPGPISLELFGMEETQDEPLELPVQATITVQSAPVSSSAPADSRLPFTGEPPKYVKSLLSGVTQPPGGMPWYPHA